MVLATTNFIMLSNQAASQTEEASATYWVMVGSSALIFLNEVWPMLFSVYRYGSFAEGMRNRKHPVLTKPASKLETVGVSLFD